MKLMPSQLVCRQAVELMSDYIEGSLSRRDRRRLEKHLEACDSCTAYLEQLRATIRASGEVVPEDLAPEVIETFTDLFRRFRADDQPTSGP
jgi:anti-sigma factor RsiW